MKKFMGALSLVFFAFASTGYAEQFITIAPGSQISLSPAVPTTVLCTDGGGSGGGKQTFCSCDYDENGSSCQVNINWVNMQKLVLKRISDGSTISVLSSGIACDGGQTPAQNCMALLKNNPACF